MVLYDDKKWLCRLIRTAFSIEDDTGICEKVLKQKPYLEGYDPDSESCESDESFDIREGGEIGTRRRSNTAVRLEKLDKEKKAQTETNFVRLNPDEPIVNKLLFEKDTTYLQRKQPSKTGAIFLTTKLLESSVNPDMLPFRKYTVFDATANPANVPCKTMAIFLTFLDESKRIYPLRVSVISTAKVLDLIGLILWNVSQSYPKVELLSPNHYSLQIADEDGEWDADFPPLDKSELIQKFSFSHLALVKSEIAQRSDGVHSITINFLLPNRTTHRLKIENPEISIGQLISLLLVESGWNTKHSSYNKSLTAGAGYHLEKFGDSKVKFLDLLLPFNQAKCRDFCLVRDGAKSIQDVSSTLPSAEAGRVAMGLSGRPDLMFSCMIPVMVSVGRFNKLKNAMCVIWSGDRMDLEYQHKVKSYPLNLVNGVKYDETKNRIVLSMLQTPSSTGVVGSHYLNTTTQLTFITREPRQASELYQHLNLNLTTRK